MDFIINNILWRVIYINPADRIFTKSDGTKTVGVTDNNTNTIYIANNLFPSFREKVITHEVCHACMFSYGVDIDLDTEEFICNFLADYGREIVDISDHIFRNIKRSIA
jgi:hypothetical protein